MSEQDGRPPPAPSVAALMDEAAERVGHDDWGDQSFVGPLGLLLDSCRSTARLNTVGWRVLRSVIVRRLRNRLHVQSYLRRHPATVERPIRSPVVVTGLPRTGTSLLHSLLAQDPRHRFLRLWEALHPVPPAADDGVDEAALIRQAEAWLERFYAMTPEFRAIHPLTPRGPEECDALLQNSFASQHFDDMFDAHDYSRWLYHATLEREYDYYALQLRVLSHDLGGRRWVLKAPAHLPHLDTLLRVLPDALVVHCHRDPADAVASYASLILAARRPHTDHVEPAAVGRQALRRSATAARRALEVRDTVGEDSFFDVDFRLLVRDPIRVVARIYDRIGTGFDAGLEAGMRGWLVDHPRDRHGEHRYDPASFDLSADRVRARFAAYLERFAGLLSRG